MTYQDRRVYALPLRWWGMAKCQRCGLCCMTRSRAVHIGGSAASDAWLRLRTPEGQDDECRYLLPADHRRRRGCAIHERPERPRVCIEYPQGAVYAVIDRRRVFAKGYEGRQVGGVRVAGKMVVNEAEDEGGGG